MPNQPVQIWVSDPTGGSIGAMQLSIIVGDGGVDANSNPLPVPTAPIIQHPIDLTSPGHVFAPSNQGSASAGLLYPQVYFGGEITNPPTFPATVQLDPDGAGPLRGLLATIMFDTTGFTSGTFPLILSGSSTVLDGLPGTDWVNSQPDQILPGSITVMAPITDRPGDRQDNPILPDNADKPEGDTSPWRFTENPSDPNGPWNERADGGAWFDPPSADGFYYEGIGTTEFSGFGAPTIGDADMMFKITPEIGLPFFLAEGAFTTFGGISQKYFTVGGILPVVDGGDPLAFPAFLSFTGGSPYAFIMVPLPEPSSVVLAMVGMVGLVGYGWRRRRA
jgi:hypothetical protein